MGRPHILSIDQFNRARVEAILVTAENMAQKIWKLFPPSPERYFIEQADIMQDQVMASVFFEPSTRTRLSFETAFSKLGGQIVSVENAFDNSSNKTAIISLSRNLPIFVILPLPHLS